MSKKTKSSKWYCHEALHLIAFFQYTWEDWVFKSVAIQAKPKLKKKADKIGSLMSELYQDVGVERFKF